jgi:hypothetical protein
MVECLLCQGRARRRTVCYWPGFTIPPISLTDVRASLLAWLQRRGGSVEDFAFPIRVDHNGHISTRQYARLVDEWVETVGLRREDYGNHSQGDRKAEAVQILFGHTKIENSVCYLGVDIEDAPVIAETTEI